MCIFFEADYSVSFVFLSNQQTANPAYTVNMEDGESLHSEDLVTNVTIQYDTMQKKKTL